MAKSSVLSQIHTPGEGSVSALQNSTNSNNNNNNASISLIRKKANKLRVSRTSSSAITSSPSSFFTKSNAPPELRIDTSTDTNSSSDVFQDQNYDTNKSHTNNNLNGLILHQHHRNSKINISNSDDVNMLQSPSQVMELTRRRRKASNLTVSTSGLQPNNPKSTTQYPDPEKDNENQLLHDNDEIGDHFEKDELISPITFHSKEDSNVIHARNNHHQQQTFSSLQVNEGVGQYSQRVYLQESHHNSNPIVGNNSNNKSDGVPLIVRTSSPFSNDGNSSNQTGRDAVFRQPSQQLQSPLQYAQHGIISPNIAKNVVSISNGSLQFVPAFSNDSNQTNNLTKSNNNNSKNNKNNSATHNPAPPEKHALKRNKTPFQSRFASAALVSQKQNLVISKQHGASWDDLIQELDGEGQIPRRLAGSAASGYDSNSGHDHSQEINTGNGGSSSVSSTAFQFSSMSPSMPTSHNPWRKGKNAISTSVDTKAQEDNHHQQKHHHSNHSNQLSLRQNNDNANSQVNNYQWARDTAKATPNIEAPHQKPSNLRLHTSSDWIKTANPFSPRNVNRTIPVERQQQQPQSIDEQSQSNSHSAKINTLPTSPTTSDTVGTSTNTPTTSADQYQSFGNHSVNSTHSNDTVSSSSSKSSRGGISNAFRRIARKEKVHQRVGGSLQHKPLRNMEERQLNRSSIGGGKEKELELPFVDEHPSDTEIGNSTTMVGKHIQQGDFDDVVNSVENTTTRNESNNVMNNGGLRVSRLASLFSSRAVIRSSDGQTKAGPLALAANKDDNGSLGTHDDDYPKTQDESRMRLSKDGVRMPSKNPGNHSMIRTTHQQSTPASPVKSNITASSSGYVDWPGTLDKNGGTVAIPSSFSFSDDGATPISRIGLRGEDDAVKSLTKNAQIGDFQDGNDERGKRKYVKDGVRLANSISSSNKDVSNAKNASSGLIYQQKNNSDGSAIVNLGRVPTDKTENPADFHLAAAMAATTISHSPPSSFAQSDPSSLLPPQSLEISPSSGEQQLNETNQTKQVINNMPQEGKRRSCGDEKQHLNKTPKNFTSNSTHSSAKLESVSGVSLDVKILKTSRETGTSTITTARDSSKIVNENSVSGNDVSSSWQSGIRSAQTYKADHHRQPEANSFISSSQSNSKEKEMEGRFDNVNDISCTSPLSSPVSSITGPSDRKKTPVIDTSASLRRVRSSGRDYPKILSPLSVDLSPPSSNPPLPSPSYSNPKSSSGVLSPHNFLPSNHLSEEALKKNEEMSASPIRANGANVKGYRGFLDKTMDVPNLMDNDSDSFTTASTMMNRKNDGQPHESIRQESKLQDSESDVFDGLSGVQTVKTSFSYIQHGKPDHNTSAATKHLYENRKAKEDATKRAENHAIGINIVRVGKSLASVQTSPEDFDKRTTSRQFDANLTESDTDFMSDDGNITDSRNISDQENGREFSRGSPHLEHRKYSVLKTELPSWPESVSPKSADNTLTSLTSPTKSIERTDSVDSEYSTGQLDLSIYAVHPKQVRKLVRSYRKMSEAVELRERNHRIQEDSTKAFALFEMRSRIMETDIERGLERTGGTVIVDDLVLTPTSQASHRIRDAVIVSKAWRDGASPRDAITASLLTRRFELAYFVKRPLASRLRPASTESTLTMSSAGLSGMKKGIGSSSGVSDCSFASCSSRSTGLQHAWEEVRWVDDTDFALLKCPSLGPRSMRGSEIFTIGDCQSILLKLTNERCVQLRKELNEATSRQLYAENLIKEEEEWNGMNEEDGTMTDAEMKYLSAMEDVKTVSRSLVVAEKAFGMVKERIERLVHKYETLLEKIDENKSIESVNSAMQTDFEDEGEDSDSEHCESDEERQKLARRAQRAELKAEVAARQAMVAKLEAEKSKQETEKIKLEKEMELDELKKKLEEMETKSAHIASEYEMRLNGHQLVAVNQRSRDDLVLNSSRSHEASGNSTHSLLYAASNVGLDQDKLEAKERIKARFRTRNLEKTQNTAQNKNTENDSPRNDIARNKYLLTGKVSQRLEFYERSLESIRRKRHRK